MCICDHECLVGISPSQVAGLDLGSFQRLRGVAVVFVSLCVPRLRPMLA